MENHQELSFEKENTAKLNRDNDIPDTSESYFEQIAHDVHSTIMGLEEKIDNIEAEIADNEDLLDKLNELAQFYGDTDRVLDLYKNKQKNEGETFDIAERIKKNKDLMINFQKRAQKLQKESRVLSKQAEKIEQRISILHEKWIQLMKAWTREGERINSEDKLPEN